MNYTTDINNPEMADNNEKPTMPRAIKDIQESIDAIKDTGFVGMISDGYHSFDELYHHRAMLFLALCLTSFKNVAWKSLLHNDPKKDPMYPGMFIVGISTPYGDATYHYNIDPYWAMFDIDELPRAPIFDGHTPNQAIDRIVTYAKDIHDKNNTHLRLSDTIKSSGVTLRDGTILDTHPKEASPAIIPNTTNRLDIIAHDTNAYDTSYYTTMSSYDLQHPTNDASNSDSKSDEEK